MNKDVSAGMVLDYEDRFALSLSAISDELIELKTNFHKLQINLHAQKMKLSIKDLVTFTEEILNEKLHFFASCLLLVATSRKKSLSLQQLILVLKQPTEVFCKKRCPQIHRNAPVPVTCNFIKEKRFFAVNFAKFLRTLFLIERICWVNEQHSRQECLVISGISESVQDNDLEDRVLKIFNECDTPVDLTNIEACHRLKSKARPRKAVIKLWKWKNSSAF